MKNTLPFFFFLLFTSQIHAQKTEIGIALNSGLFSFSGISANKNTFINFNTKNNSGYTNNPYGSEFGLCYGISGNIKRVIKSTFVFGVDAGYEILRSKINIDNVYTDKNNKAIGETFLNFNTININPFLGRRFNANNISLDVLVGFDFIYILGANEKGNAKTNDDVFFETSKDRTTISFDLRPRVQFTVNYQKTGVYFGYSHGLANYKSGYVGGTNTAHGNMIRFGVSYQIM